MLLLGGFGVHRVPGEREEDVVHARLGDIDLVERGADFGERFDDVRGATQIAKRRDQLLATQLQLAGGERKRPRFAPTPH